MDYPINTLDFNIFQFIDELDRKSAFMLISKKTIRAGPHTVNQETFTTFLSRAFEGYAE
jgi:hypothetical protein